MIATMPNPVVKSNKMQATQLQTNIINFAQTQKGNVVVSAAPGSGKTTLLKLMTDTLLAQNPNCQILAVSYTNSIKQTLTEKLDPRCHIYSLHQIGLSLLKNSKIARRFERNEELHGKNGSPDNKYKIIYRDLVGQDYSLKTEGRIAYPIINECMALTDKIRLELADINDPAAVARVAHKYSLNYNDMHLNYIRQGLERGERTYINFSWSDFIDMVYLPIVFDCNPTEDIIIGNKDKNFNCKHLDFILVDEFQDASPIIHRIIEKFAKKYNARLVLVGDPNQSCFGFSGAHSESMELAKSYFNCTELPLNETFRCPESHVELLNRTFGTNIISRRGIQGEITAIPQADMYSYIEPGDMILSRTNAELFTCFLRLLQEKIPARLIKLDVLEFFNDLFDKIEKENRKLWMDVYGGINEYVTLQTVAIINKYNTYRATEMITELNNNVEVLFAYLDYFKPTNRADFFTGLKKLLDNNNRENYVSLLTVHTGKGLEANGVFVLNANKFPYFRDGMTPEQMQQERNVQFVALSRSLNHLYLVSEF